MSETANPAREADLLLPWYATGRLRPDEAARLDREIAEDAELAHHLELTVEERDEARIVAESGPLPSARARQAVFARIATLPGGSAAPSRPGLMNRLLAFVESLTPRTVASTWFGWL